MRDIFLALKIKTDEEKMVNLACGFIIHRDLIQNKEGFMQTVEAALASDKYSIWQLLLKLAVQEHSKKKKIENMIMENRLFGYGSIDDLSREFFCKDSIPQLKAFFL